MNTGLNFPAGNPLDPSGNLTPQWRMFFLTLFTRSGGTSGNDTSTLQAAISAANANISDLQAEGGAGVPVPDMTAVYAAIHVVEAIAAQAMAAATQQPDERGEAGDGATLAQLSQRIAELEGRIEALSGAPSPSMQDIDAQIAAGSYAPTDTAHLTNGAGFLASGSAASVASVTSAGPVTAVAASSTTYAMTAARSGVSSQNLGIGGLATSNSIDSYCAASNAKQLTFNATTDAGNTTPTAGSVGIQWSILGVAKMLLNQSGNLLVGTTTDDGSGNPIQSNAGLSIKPATTTSAPAAGAAGALPATPTGYATIRIGGTDRKIAYY